MLLILDYDVFRALRFEFYATYAAITIIDGHYAAIVYEADIAADAAMLLILLRYADIAASAAAWPVTPILVIIITALAHARYCY